MRRPGFPGAENEESEQSSGRACGGRGSREQVGKDAADGEPGLQEQQERRAADLSHRRDGERKGDESRNPGSPTQPGRHRGRCEDYPAGSNDGERKPWLDRLPRVRPEQHEHCQAERGQRTPLFPAEVRRQQHARHDRRALHARVGANDDHEADERAAGDTHPDPPAGAECTRTRDGCGDDEGAVRAGD